MVSGQNLPLRRCHAAGVFIVVASGCGAYFLSRNSLDGTLEQSKYLRDVDGGGGCARNRNAGGAQPPRLSFDAPRVEHRGCQPRGVVGCTRGARGPYFSSHCGGDDGGGVGVQLQPGAWLGTAIGLLYLARAHGKFKWSLKLFLFSIFCFLFLVCVVWFFWNNTPDSAPWYLKRMDFGRASAQHRVAAWKAGFEIMRDHPFGVGWNKTVETYDKYYSPPEGSAAAITTNDYLMLGTQLGIPGLACFLAYVVLCFRRQKAESRKQKSEMEEEGEMENAEGRRQKEEKHLTPALSPFDPSTPVKRGEGEAGESVLGVEAVSPVTCPLSLVTTPVTRHSSLQTACLAGALSMLVAFWFDGGLFHLPTAAVFWILLELGSERQKLKTEMLKPRMDTDLEQGKRFSARRQK